MRGNGNGKEQRSVTRMLYGTLFCAVPHRAAFHTMPYFLAGFRLAGAFAFPLAGAFLASNAPGNSF